MTTSSLDDEIADLSGIEQLFNSKLSAVRRKKAALVCEKIARQGQQRLVNDHALIRYLERHKGIDIEAVRDEMRLIAADSVPAKDGEHHWHPSGVLMVIGEWGQIITVLSPEQTQKWTGRKLANGERIALNEKTPAAFATGG